ncbi:unnamed protein product [Mytilus coruscus]|uniref:Uncharacterized protein n=1 Tax=Mytilus coruscus TaxID=42192 RepID=A0A6J8DDA3_MYTCO|nr:unnamed protein product [Mytilus coruscus]
MTKWTTDNMDTFAGTSVVAVTSDFLFFADLSKEDILEVTFTIGPNKLEGTLHREITLKRDIPVIVSSMMLHEDILVYVDIGRNGGISSINLQTFETDAIINPDTCSSNSISLRQGRIHFTDTKFRQDLVKLVGNMDLCLVSSFTQPSGIAAEGKTLYVCDSDESSVLMVTPTKGMVKFLTAVGDLYDCLMCIQNIDHMVKELYLNSQINVKSNQISISELLYEELIGKPQDKNSSGDEQDEDINIVMGIPQSSGTRQRRRPNVGAHLCSAITSIDCRHPSLNARLCFCRCLDAKINRKYLEVTFHLIFPLYELTDSLNHKLKLDKRYTVSIQPRCTSCDDFCEFLQDMEIPPAVVTSPISIENVEPSKWLYVAVVMSVFVVIMVAVGALILVCRHLKTHQESPLNNRNIQYSNVGKDVENNPSIYSVDHNDMPFSRQIQITSEQGKPESNLHKSTKTINIISLNTDKTFIEELSTFIPTNVFKFKVLDPEAIVVETPTGYSFQDQMLENKINLVVLNNSVVNDLLGNSDTNGSITNLCRRSTFVSVDKKRFLYATRRSKYRCFFETDSQNHLIAN